MKTLLTLLLASWYYSINAVAEVVPADSLFQSFRQGARPNCASVALIKAALSAYGQDGVFNSYNSIENNHIVVLKNGDKVEFTTDELNKARQAAGFVLKSSSPYAQQLKESAEVIFCVMAKYKQKIDKKGNDFKYKDFDAALTALKNGAHTPSVYKYLGLAPNVNIVLMPRFSDINNFGSVVAWNKVHAVFSSNGSYDKRGKKQNNSLKYYGRFRLI